MSDWQEQVKPGRCIVCQQKRQDTINCIGGRICLYHAECAKELSKPVKVGRHYRKSFQ